MSDIGYWLSKKYAIQQQGADTTGRLQNAQAAHINAETGELPANARATRAQAYGSAAASEGAGAASRAHAGLLTVNAGLAPGLANAEIAQRNAAAGLATSQADATTDLTHFNRTENPLLDVVAGRRFGLNLGVNPNAAPASPYMRSVTSLPMDSAPRPAAPAAPAPATSGGFDDGSTPLPPGWRAPSIAGFSHGTSNVPAPGAPDVHGDALAAFGARLGYKPAAQHTPPPIQHHAMGTSNIMDLGQPAAGGTSSSGNNIPGTPAGPSFTGANPTHGSDPRNIPGTSFANGPNVNPPNSVPGYAAGTSNTQDDQGMQPNPSGAPLGAPGGSPAPVGATGATSWGGVGMPEPAGKGKSFKKGTDKVPGQGDGKTDTVKSMLAPGEAVLNKAAAEHLGRDTIDLLNAAGARAMGMDGGGEPTAQPGVAPAQGKIPGHKKGTSDVSKPDHAAGGQAPAAQAGPGHKAPPSAGKGPDKAAPKDAKKADKEGAPVKGAAKKSSGITPEMITALAGMMHGGAAGGMPAPMGPPPVAQPMPQPQIQRQ